MEPDFWHARWRENQIGFHQDDGNPLLRRYWPEFGLTSGAKVFVPLCGKSRDLIWLRDQGYAVSGIEISRLAVETFIAEHGLQCTRRDGRRFVEFECADLQLRVGDFFALGAEDLADVAAVFDRAALVALPPAMRRRYAAHLAAILPPAVKILLVSVDYPQTEMAGPPFAVAEPEVRALFTPAFRLSHLHTEDVLAGHAHFRERGLTRLVEQVSLLER